MLAMVQSNKFCSPKLTTSEYLRNKIYCPMTCNVLREFTYDRSLVKTWYQSLRECNNIFYIRGNILSHFLDGKSWQKILAYGLKKIAYDLYIFCISIKFMTAVWDNYKR